MCKHSTTELKFQCFIGSTYFVSNTTALHDSLLAKCHCVLFTRLKNSMSKVWFPTISLPFRTRCVIHFEDPWFTHTALERKESYSFLQRYFTCSRSSLIPKPLLGASETCHDTAFHVCFILQATEALCAALGYFHLCCLTFRHVTFF